MKRFLAAALTATLLSPIATHGAETKTPAQSLMSKLQWRSIGPYIGGRVVAIAGVPSDPDLFYMGGVQGGIWKSTNYGQNWTNISDGQLPGIADPIGALAVAPSNHKVIYAGTGEADVRQDFDTGDGIYKSADAGKTWKYAGLRDAHMTTSLAIDPRNADVVYASSMGHVFKPNAERGIFKTTDGGKTWNKILFVDENTGGVQVVMDPHDPNVLYAAMWQAQRLPWTLTSGGPGSGLYKTTDGGAHWTKISTQSGFRNGNPRKDRRVGFGARPTRCVRDGASRRRGRIPLQRRRRYLDARKQRNEAPAARFLLHRNLCRSHEHADRVRAASGRRL